MPKKTHQQLFNQGRWDAYCHRDRRETNEDMYHIGYNTGLELQFHNGDYRYCMLPSGNASEFPKLDEELMRRGITFAYKTLREGCGRVYRIHHTQASKLPTDDHNGCVDVPYLGDKNSGHSIYHFPEADLEDQDMWPGISIWWTEVAPV